jgi:hypothetical protein
MRRLVQAVGFAALLFLIDYYILLFSSGDALLHSAVPLRNVALANLIDIAGAGLFLVLLLAALRRTSSWPASQLALATVLPVLLFYRNAALIPWPPRPRSFFLWLWPGLASWRWPPAPGTVALLALAWAVLLLILYFRAARAYGLVVRSGAIVLTGFGIFAAMVCLQLIQVAAWHPGPQAIQSAITRPPAPASHPVIVWMIFDELSHDQTFDHRALDLALPNFDRLRSQSTLYSRVEPAGFATSTVLPSLFLGKTVTRSQYSSPNEFKIRTLDEPEWKTFDPERTIFAAARAHGWKSAITGWWNPYCPALRNVVESCYWSNWDAFDVPMSPQAGLWRNSVAPLEFLARDVLNPAGADSRAAAFSAQQHRLSYQDLYRRAASMLTDSDADFLFLHLPIPHPPQLL